MINWLLCHPQTIAHFSQWKTVPTPYKVVSCPFDKRLLLIVGFFRSNTLHCFRKARPRCRWQNHPKDYAREKCRTQTKPLFSKWSTFPREECREWFFGFTMIQTAEQPISLHLCACRPLCFPNFHGRQVSQLAERVSVLVASMQKRCDEDKEAGHECPVSGGVGTPVWLGFKEVSTVCARSCIFFGCAVEPKNIGPCSAGSFCTA